MAIAHREHFAGGGRCDDGPIVLDKRGERAPGALDDIDGVAPGEHELSVRRPKGDSLVGEREHRRKPRSRFERRLASGPLAAVEPMNIERADERIPLQLEHNDIEESMISEETGVNDAPLRLANHES